MRTVNRFKQISNAIGCELGSDGSRQVRYEMHVAVKAGRVGRNTGNGLFDEARGQRVACEEEFIRAIDEFDASPRGIPSAEADRGFEQIAVEARVPLDRTRAA